MATARAAFLRFSLRSTLSSFSGKQTKDLPVKVLHVAATPPFKTLLEAQSYLGHRQKFWERYAKLPVIGCAEWEVITQASRNSFICSHPDTCGSCAWEYFSARPVPVGKWHCCRPLLRTDCVIWIIACSLGEWRRQEGRELFLLSSRYNSLVALSSAKI